MKSIWIFALSCLVSFLLYPIISYFSLPLASPALQQYFVVKDYINQHTPKSKKRLIIMSASDGMFGIDGNLIDKQTDYYPINYSIYFGTGLSWEFRINKLISSLKPYDTVILPLHYSFYFTPHNPHYFSYYQNLLSWADSSFLYSHPLLSLQTLFKSPPSKILAGFIANLKNQIELTNLLPSTLHRWKKNEQVFNGISVSSLDRYGELSHHKGTLLKGNTTDHYFDDDEKISPYFLTQFKKLQEFCKTNHIKLILTYPPTLKNPKFDLSSQNDQQKLQKLIDQLKEHQIFLIGDPQDSQFPITHFYDSVSHLNSIGARANTLRIIKLLNSSSNLP